MSGPTAAAALWGAEVQHLIAARENAVYEIALPGGMRAVLRLHRPGYQTGAAIDSELWWCDALATRGLAVPRPLASQTGRWLERLENGGFASVVGWVEGAPLSDGPVKGRDLPGLFARLGALVARLHVATDGLTLPPDFARPRWDRDGLLGDAPLWGRFWEHPLLSPPERAALENARNALNVWLATHADRAEGLIHADLLTENIFVNDRSLSLIDFDDAGFGFRGYDLGTAMVQHLTRPERDEILAALAEGYQTNRPMTEAEVARFALARVLASVGWVMSRRPMDDPIHKSHIFRALTWWQTVQKTYF